MRTEPQPDWQDLAACQEVDPDVFFPAPTDRMTIRRAKTICDGCEVREQCLQYAMERDEMFGIWGSTTELERKAMRRRARRLA